MLLDAIVLQLTQYLPMLPRERKRPHVVLISLAESRNLTEGHRPMSSWLPVVPQMVRFNSILTAYTLGLYGELWF